MRSLYAEAISRYDEQAEHREIFHALGVQPVTY
jgi:hypothetical protein